MGSFPPKEGREPAPPLQKAGEPTSLSSAGSKTRKASGHFNPPDGLPTTQKPRQIPLGIQLQICIIEAISSWSSPSNHGFEMGRFNIWIKPCLAG